VSPRGANSIIASSTSTIKQCRMVVFWLVSKRCAASSRTDCDLLYWIIIRCRMFQRYTDDVLEWTARRYGLFTV